MKSHHFFIVHQPHDKVKRNFMKNSLLDEIYGNIGSFNKTANYKLYKTTLKKFKKSIDFSQRMWYYNIKERGRTSKYRQVWRIRRRFHLPTNRKGLFRWIVKLSQQADRAQRVMAWRRFRQGWLSRNAKLRISALPRWYRSESSANLTERASEPVSPKSIKKGSESNGNSRTFY